MELYYVLEKNGIKLGPFTFNDVKNHTIYSDELVWRSDSENWKRASEFDELNGTYIFKQPPSIVEEKTTGTNDTKKNVDISEQLIISLLIGFSISFLAIVLSHISPSDWVALPITNNNSFFTLGDKVSLCSYKCILGDRHSANCRELLFYEVNNKSLTAAEIFTGSFAHFSTILMVGLIISAIIYILKRFNFKVV